MEIYFTEAWRISGAAIRTYLLERSRIVQISDPERSYHIFYQLCSADESQKAALQLGRFGTHKSETKRRSKEREEERERNTRLYTINELIDGLRMVQVRPRTLII